jgi:NitT/TauT family transport system substrate-binding protein
MSPLPPGPSSRLSRRSVIAGAAALAAVPFAAARAAAPFRVGLLAFGTGDWEMKTITDHGLDTAAGLKVQAVPLATNDAARIAFLSGSVDAIISDLLFAARLKAEGKGLQYLPYSTTEGALMVAAGSPIKSVADLAGKSIGVAGGPLDKSWLLLRAEAQRQGIDLQKAARPAFGAPPLLAAKLESGELDCGLLYWSACARLEAKGFRRVAGVEQIADTLGAKGKVALVGFLVRPGVETATLVAFGKAVRAAEDVLQKDPQAWETLRPMMQAPDDATFEALKSAHLRGIPKKPRAEEIADAQAFFAIVAKLGGAALVGEATSLPADLYVDAAVYG